MSDDLMKGDPGHPIVWREVLQLREGNKANTFTPSRLPDFTEYDGELRYTNDVFKMYEVARAGGQEAYAASLTKDTVEEEYFAGSLIKTFKQGPTVYKVETRKGGVLVDVTDGQGRSFGKNLDAARFAKNDSMPKLEGWMAKVFSTAADGDGIDMHSVSHPAR